MVLFAATYFLLTDSASHKVDFPDEGGPTILHQSWSPGAFVETTQAIMTLRARSSPGIHLRAFFHSLMRLSHEVHSSGVR